MKKFVVAAIASFVLSAIAAEPAPSTVGAVDKVAGTVSVGNLGTVAPAKVGMRFYNGSTVLVSAKGETTLAFDNGCRVTLRGSQQVTVDSKLPCEALIASVKTLTPVVAGATVPTARTISLIGLGAVGIYLINRDSDDPVSGS